MRNLMVGAVLMTMSACGAGEPATEASLQTQESALTCTAGQEGWVRFGTCRGANDEGTELGYCWSPTGVAAACNNEPCYSVDDCRAVCTGGTASCDPV